MSLILHENFNFHGVNLKSGGIYRFNYANFLNDPEPLILNLHVITGTHPTSGRQWNLIQAINLNYIPRKDRIVFSKDWRIAWEYSKNISLTWQHIKRHYPYIEFGVRRYLIRPDYIISNLKDIKKEDFDGVIAKSMFKDYSDYIKRQIIAKWRKVRGSGRKVNTGNPYKNGL